MSQLTFSDGMKFNTDGQPRLVRKSDGLYVCGHGMLIPVDDAKEGQEIINEMVSQGKEAKRQGANHRLR